jgi:DMSO/TMAO reductase YedYZ molybdopterin-dependent catalytic subunit
MATRGPQDATTVSRRDVVRMGAAGLPTVVLAARAGTTPLPWQPAETGSPSPTSPSSPPPAPPPSPTSPFFKPVPADLFTIFGTNAEMRWDSVDHDRFRTPNERFFVRDHTFTPLIDASTWRLEIFGSGLRGDAVSFTYDQLRRLPQRSATVAIECAGNGRRFYDAQRHPVEPGGHRCGPLAGCPPVGVAGPRRHRRHRGGRHARGARCPGGHQRP